MRSNDISRRANGEPLSKSVPREQRRYPELSIAGAAFATTTGNKPIPGQLLQQQNQRLQQLQAIELDPRARPNRA